VEKWVRTGFGWWLGVGEWKLASSSILPGQTVVDFSVLFYAL
jgi:hypothetical protein